MKFISVKSDENGRQIVCDNAAFDAGLAKITCVDKEEKIILVDYDGAEIGHSLRLPFATSSSRFIIKATTTGIHAGLLVSLCDDEAYETYYAYLNSCGDIEFDVILDNQEIIVFQQLFLSSL